MHTIKKQIYRSPQGNKIFKRGEFPLELAKRARKQQPANRILLNAYH